MFDTVDELLETLELLGIIQNTSLLSLILAGPKLRSMATMEY